MPVNQRLEGEVVILVPTGMLGAGVKVEHIRQGIARGAVAIAVDSGSTDSGPYYLARGISKMNRESVRHDLRVLIAEASKAGIPLLVGSCATSGTDQGVNWTLGIVNQVVRELNISPKIACLYSEQDKTALKQLNALGQITPLEPMGELSDATLESCYHIVALMGPEPYIKAIEEGADIVLGGRTSDAAVIAAVALMKGAGSGAAWHAGKVAECGGQCTEHPYSGGVLARIGKDAFDIEPLDLLNRASPESVSAHLLYETADPFCLVEPGGVLHIEQASYESIDQRITRVKGAIWEPRPYTMKLEGASGGYFQTIMVVGIEDPDVLGNLDAFHDKMQQLLTERVNSVFGEEVMDFDLSLRIYGWNGTSGRKVPDGTAPPMDVGVMLVVTAPSQDEANRIAQCCNPMFFHMPMRPDVELPSYAFPFTPAEIPRGQVFEFMLNHVVHARGGLDLVRLEWKDCNEAMRPE